jgi:cupin superfamily acireductone dioxygenase involved in methionine salvage
MAAEKKPRVFYTDEQIAALVKRMEAAPVIERKTKKPISAVAKAVKEQIDNLMDNKGYTLKDVVDFFVKNGMPIGAATLKKSLATQRVNLRQKS